MNEEKITFTKKQLEDFLLACIEGFQDATSAYMKDSFKSVREGFVKQAVELEIKMKEVR
jgi:hypothetical protein